MALLQVVALWHVVAILVFVHGFLLTRVELPHVSSCEDAVPRPAGLPGPACWGHRAFDRAAIVIIDALRYDFLIRDGYNASYPYAGLMPRTLATAKHAVGAALLGWPPRIAPLGAPVSPTIATPAGRCGRRAALCGRHPDHHHEQAQGAGHGARPPFPPIAPLPRPVPRRHGPAHPGGTAPTAPIALTHRRAGCPPSWTWAAASPPPPSPRTTSCASCSAWAGSWWGGLQQQRQLPGQRRATAASLGACRRQHRRHLPAQRRGTARHIPAAAALRRCSWATTRGCR